MLKFEERSFFLILLGTTNTEDCARSPTNEKPVKMSKIGKIHTQCDCFNQNFAHGTTQTIFQIGNR